MSKITEKIFGIANPIVEENNCSLWDVEYVKEAGSWYLRIYIDKDGGVWIEDCEKISRALDPVLDEADIIPDSYIFEVCSAGLERQLKRPSDFEKFMGSEVEVRLYRADEGSKVYVGTLESYDNGNVGILYNNSTKLFSSENISLVKLHVTF